MNQPAEIDKLLSKLCIELGFCLPPNECEKLRSSPPSTPDAFARAVFQAEGLDVNLVDLHLLRQVQRYVIDALQSRDEFGGCIREV
nr:hypothetical protein [uncultured Roseateles sp.]